MALTIDSWQDSTSTGSALDAFDTTASSNYLIITGGSTTTATPCSTGSTDTAVYYGSGGNWQQAAIQVPRKQVVQTPKQQALRDPRILNRYLNAADLLEEFIKDLGDLGARQTDVLAVPIEMFVNWLVCKAAEEDDAETDLPALPGKIQRTDRCKDCGRYIAQQRRDAAIYFCSGEHQEAYLQKRTVRDLPRIDQVQVGRVPHERGDGSDAQRRGDNRDLEPVRVAA